MRASWGGKGFGGIGTAELLAPNGSPPVPNPGVFRSFGL